MTPKLSNTTIYIWIFYILSIAVSAYGNDIQFTEEEQNWLNEHPHITMGFSDTLEPYGIIQHDGSSSGIAADHFQLLAERLNISIKLELAPWSTILQKAKTREIDGIAAILPAHGKTYDLDTSIPLRFNATATAYIDTLSNLKITKKEDLQGHRIVVLSGMLYAKNFLQPIAETITITEVNSSEEAFALLLNSEADVFLGLNMDHYTITKHFIGGVRPAKIFWDSTFNVFMGIRNDEPLLVSVLKKANASLTNDEILTIQRRWLEIPMGKEPSLFTQKEQDFIDQHPEIQVGINLNYAPFEFMDNNKSHQGIAHDLLKIISNKTGFKFIAHPNWSEEKLHHQIQDGALDMLSTQIISTRHGEHLIYSDPVMTVPLVLLARQGTDFISGISQITGQSIGVVQNNYPEEFLRNQYPDANIIQYRTLEDGLFSLSKGACDFFLETLPQANQVIRSKGIAGISLVGKTKKEAQFAFALGKDSSELQSILNKTLAAISPDQKLELQQKITKLTIAQQTNWLPIIQIGTIALIIVVLMIIWNRRLQLEIKARKRAESSLQLAKLTLDTIPLHIIWVDEQFNIKMANKAALKITGFSLIEIQAKKVWDINPSFANASQCHNAWQKVKAQKSLTLTGQLKCHDGTIIPTEMSLTYLQPPKETPYVVSISADITTRKEQEQELQQSKINLKKALVKTKESSRLKSEFLSNMSHEIRTPLNAIIGYSEMLDQGNLPTDKQHYVHTIIKSGKTLISLINDILDLSKLEAGKIKIVPIAINPKLFFDDIIAIFEPKLLEKQLAFKVELDPHLPTSILIDEIRIRQILFNLIGNSIKFTEKGSIKIAVSFTQTQLSIGTITIAVTDTGIGIAEHDQHLIFQSFQQKSSGISRQYGGAGLGLTISKRFVELMRGKIHLKSTVGKGSCFTVTIPEIPIAGTPAIPEKAVTCDLTNLQPATILITDDIKTNRDLIKACLQDTSLTILTAINGKEAIEIAKQQKLALIFMDIKMDTMGGIEATTKIHNDHETDSIPIIGLSGAEPDQEALEVFDDFLQKPFSLQDIRQKIFKFLGTSGAKQQTTNSLPKVQEPLPLTETEQQTLLDMITIAESTGILADYKAIAKKLEEYGNKYTHKTLSSIGTSLSANTESGAIIQIEDQLLELVQYIQESA